MVKGGYDENDINFETIINVVEELLIYYSSFDKDKKTPSLLKVFFSSSFEEILLNFSIEGGVVKHGFKLETPKGKTYDERDGKNGYELLQQKFINVFTHYLNNFTSKRINENCNEYFNEKIIVHAIGMKEFLATQQQYE